MEPRYSGTYVDQLVETRDNLALYQLISVVGRRAELPDELWAFNRVLEWLGSTRSGVWQYYEAVDQGVLSRLDAWFSRVGWQDLGDRYAEGMRDVAAGGNCDDLDRWLDEHEDDIIARLWSLALSQIAWLKTTAGT